MRDMQVTHEHAPDRLPHALDTFPIIVEQVGGRDLAFFLDFDGTLAPIAPRPDLACLPASTATLLAALAKRHLVCILSGRALPDLRRKVAIPGVFYGADHGRHIIGPDESGIEHVVGAEAREDLRSASRLLQQRLADIEGVIVEEKDLSLSVHYRLTAEAHRPVVSRRVQEWLPASSTWLLAGASWCTNFALGTAGTKVRPCSGCSSVWV